MLKRKVSPLSLLRGIERRLVKGWCQGPAAKDKWGQGVEVESPRACKWCLIGAMWAQAGGYHKSYSTNHIAVDRTRSLLETAIEQKWSYRDPSIFGSIVSFNEARGRTKRQVLAVVRAAQRLALGRRRTG